MTAAASLERLLELDERKEAERLLQEQRAGERQQQHHHHRNHHRHHNHHHNHSSLFRNVHKASHSQSLTHHLQSNTSREQETDISGTKATLSSLTTAASTATKIKRKDPKRLTAKSFYLYNRCSGGQLRMQGRRVTAQPLPRVSQQTNGSRSSDVVVGNNSHHESDAGKRSILNLLRDRKRKEKEREKRKRRRREREREQRE